MAVCASPSYTHQVKTACPVKQLANAGPLFKAWSLF